MFRGVQIFLGVVFLSSGVLSASGKSTSLREAIAQAWAPIFFKDYAHEFTDQVTGFNPVDHPVDLFFAGTGSIESNAKKIFQLSVPQQKQAMKKVPLYYSVIESTTHFYINYFFYHAVDMKDFGHAHDTENVWTIIEKDGSPYGKLIMHIANAHGYPMIYGPEMTARDAWRLRSRLSPHISKILFGLDRFAQDHHSREVSEYVERKLSKSILLFVSSKTHAIYQFNPMAWQAQKGVGGVYYPASCLECRGVARAYAYEAEFEYELVNWDDLFFEILKSPSQRIFVQKSKSHSLTAWSRSRELPDHLWPAPDEGLARVNLFTALKFKTPYSLSTPAELHSFLAGSRKGVSHKYIFNPYVENPKSDQRSPWLLISNISNALPTVE